MNPLNCSTEKNKMKYMMIDGAVLQSKEHLHEIFAWELSLPEWYGGNLDALHDCLTDIAQDTVISIVNLHQIQDELASYCWRLVQVLHQSAKENSHLHINVL